MDSIKVDPIEWFKSAGDYLSSWWSDGAVRVDTAETGTRNARSLLVVVGIAGALAVAAWKGR